MNQYQNSDEHTYQSFDTLINEPTGAIITPIFNYTNLFVSMFDKPINYLLDPMTC